MSPKQYSEKLSEFMYHKKDANINTSLYDIVLNSLKKRYAYYNQIITKMNDPVIKVNYTVTVDTGVIPVMEHEYDKIQWNCNTYISTDSGQQETLKEAMTRPNRHLWEMAAISEVKHFLSKKAWIPNKEKRH